MKTGIIEPYFVEGKGVFVPLINKILAAEDAYNGEPVCFERAVRAGAPTVNEWRIILFFKAQINKLLRDNGAKPLAQHWYWSSTHDRLDGYSAWGVNLLDGSMLSDSRAYDDYVRPLLAL